MLTEIIPTPVVVFKFEGEGALGESKRFKNLPSGWYHFFANAIAWNNSNTLCIHICGPHQPSEFYPARSCQFATGPPAASVTEVLVEECGDLAERLSVLRHAIVELVLSMRLAFVDLKLCVNAGLAQPPVYAHRVA